MTLIRILVVDDQALVRTGIRATLETEPDLTVVGEAGDGQEALDQATALRPDVVLMDLRMPKMNGTAATAALLRRHPAIRVLALTTFDLDEYAFAALRAGASGFMLKDARPDDLRSAIRAVATGEAALSPRIAHRILEIFGPRLPASPTGSTAELTPREHDVLMAIALGRTNPEIAADLFLSESTVKTHVGRVFAKLELRDRVHAVIYAYEHGLL